MFSENFKIFLLIGFYVVVAWFLIGTLYQWVKYSGLYHADPYWAANKQLKLMLAIPGKIWNFSLTDFFIWMVNWPFIIWLIVVIIVLRYILKIK